MKILLIHQVFVSPGDAGGTRHYELAKYAQRQGHEVTIIASDLSYLTGERVKGARGLVTEENIDGIRVIRAYTCPTLHRSFVWRVVSFLSFMVTAVWAGMRAGPTDVVMGTSPPIFQAFSAYLISRLRRRPFLLEIRDLWPDFAIDMGILRNSVLIRGSKWLEMFLYRRAAHIIVNSPAYRDIISGKGISKEMITLISNGVDPDMFNPNSRGAEIRREFHLGDSVVVLYAGALGVANDIPTILNAAERLRHRGDIRWILVGDGKERQHLEGLVREMGLSRSVVFSGARPKSEMSEILAAADICVATLQDIPMFRTTYPNKVFDYMAAGRPTILAIDGVIRKVIELSNGGVYVPPGDDAGMAMAVLELAGDPGRRSVMGRSAREHVVRHFHRASQAKLFIEVSLECLTTSAASAAAI